MDETTIASAAFLKEHADKLADIINRYEGTYAGTWIDSALELYQQGYFEDASEAFTKARDSFMPESNPDEYNTLNMWVLNSDDKAGTDVDTETALTEDAPSGDMILRSMMISKAIVSEVTAELAALLGSYKDKYAGTYVASAVDFYKKGFFEDAAENFEKARDSFMPEDNPEEYNLLDTWADDSWARSLEVTDVEVASDKVAEESDLLGLGTKSLIEKAEGEPDRACMQNLWKQFYKFYSGKWIAAAMKLYNQKKYTEAGKAFAQARDGFQANKNPNEFKCLDSWRTHCEKMSGAA